ncbi:Vacuolar protein sorting-associated protein atg6 [Naganishia albida]|nr:Vacuolar protein sorting-associated protein atg6 [Naganishia albida]
MADQAYTCQRCKQPLLLDASLSDLSQSQYDIIAGSLPPEEQDDPSSSLTQLEKLARIPALPESKAAYLSTLQEREQRRKDRHHPQQSRQHVGVGGHRHPAESFVLLSQSQIAPPAPHDTVPGIHRSKTTLGIGSASRPTKPAPSGKQNMTASLLSLLTSRTPNDHPLCADCAKALQDTLQSRLEDVQRERDAYISFERNFQDTKRRKEASSGGEKGAVYEGTDIPLRTSVYDTFSPAEFGQLQQYKTRLETQNATLLARLTELEAESEALAAEEREVDEEDARLAEEERAFLVSYQEVEQDIHRYEAQLATEKTLHLLATQTLQRLESANVYNDVFQIGHVPLNPGRSPTATGQAGHTGQTVGTINGLRLGGRPVVEWAEINAALGLVALCIDRMAVKVGCTFETYKIVPLGSFSRVDELPPSKNTYELYASTDLSAARLLQNRRFNYALTGMLDCLRQLIAFGKVRGRGWAGGGIEIQKDKIAGHSIKLSANMGMSALGLVGSVSGGSAASPSSTEAEESWTRALRAVLAVLKRILVIESEADRDERVV